MPVSQEDIDALTDAIASGEKTITKGGVQVTYRSIAELIQARDLLIREFNQQNPATPPRPAKTIALQYGGRGCGFPYRRGWRNF